MKVLEPSITDEGLAKLERDTFKYFADETNLENGLVPDNTRHGAPCSIAVVGFALTAYPVAVERGYMTRAEAVKRSLLSLRFFHNGPQGTGPDAIGYKGFYYHFLDMKTGCRVWNCEVSTIDTNHLCSKILSPRLSTTARMDAASTTQPEVKSYPPSQYARPLLTLQLPNTAG